MGFLFSLFNLKERHSKVRHEGGETERTKEPFPISVNELLCVLDLGTRSSDVWAVILLIAP